MVARGRVQKAVHDRDLHEQRAAAIGQHTTTTSSSKDTAGGLTATLRARRNRLRRVKIRL